MAVFAMISMHHNLNPIIPLCGVLVCGLDMFFSVAVSSRGGLG